MHETAGTVARGDGGERCVVTILFTDIEGFAGVTEDLGDERAHALLRVHNAIVRREIASHGGAEVKAQGDGFMIAFPSATDALACAVAVQRRFAAHPAMRPVRVRIGLHTGDTIAESADFFGKTVILAARITAAAGGAEILASADVVAAADGGRDVRLGTAREIDLPGLSERHRVYAVEW
jgi:class 3 adenylate cyclase